MKAKLQFVAGVLAIPAFITLTIFAMPPAIYYFNRWAEYWK